MSGEAAALSDLVRRAVAGEQTAADELVRQWAPSVRAAVRGRIGAGLHPRFDTDDVVQSTMAVALQDLAEFEYRDERTFRAWLLRIAERRLRMAARRHQASCRDVRREQGHLPTVSPKTPSTSVTQAASRNDEHRRIREAVASLKDIDRKVIELRGFRGLSHKEVAAALGLPSEDAARLRFRRALTVIRATLRKQA